MQGKGRAFLSLQDLGRKDEVWERVCEFGK